MSAVDGEDAEVFDGAARVLGIELGLLEAEDFPGRDRLLVLVVEALLVPLRRAEVSHAECLSAAEQNLTAMHQIARAPQRGAGDAGTGVDDVAELMEVDAVDLDAVAREQVVLVAALDGVAGIQRRSR